MGRRPDPGGPWTGWGARAILRPPMDANGPAGPVPTTRLAEAQTKLDRALARLEAALRARARRAGVADRELAAELEAARARCATLEDQARMVSQWLDATIERVRGLLER